MLPLVFVKKPEYILGHDPLGRRPNIRVELEQIRPDPLHELLHAIGFEAHVIVSDDRTRYQDAYTFYYLAMDRYLHAMSVAARHSRGPRRSRKYSANDRKLAEQYRRVAPFLEFDLANCLLHSRILLDRVAGLSRYFLSGKTLPSFTSFSDHKKFFTKLMKPYGEHEEYAEFIRKNTDWFDMPLKAVRDKFVVHASPKHMRLLAYPGGSGYELDLMIMLPDSEGAEKPFTNVKVIMVSPLRLSHDVEAFLNWFCRYGVASLKSRL